MNVISRHLQPVCIRLMMQDLNQQFFTTVVICLLFWWLPWSSVDWELKKKKKNRLKCLMAVLLSAKERRPNESWSFSWCSDCSQGIAGIFYYSFISILISCRLCRVTARRSLLCRKIIVPPPFFWFLFISLRLLSLRYLFFHPSTHFTNITLIFFFYFLTKFYQLSHSHSCFFCSVWFSKTCLTLCHAASLNRILSSGSKRPNDSWKVSLVSLLCFQVFSAWEADCCSVFLLRAAVACRFLWPVVGETEGQPSCFLKPFSQNLETVSTEKKTQLFSFE